MKICIKISLLVLVTLSSSAAIPTMEGLFRNGINPDIVQDLAVLVVKMKNIKVNQVEVENEEEKLALDNSKYYKILYNNTAQGPQDVIVATYKNANLEDSELEAVKSYRNEKEMITSSPLLHKRLTMAILNMFALNSSNGISGVLKELDSEFMTNKEMVNKDKKELLEKYRRFLLAKKDYDQKIKDMKKNGANINEMEKISAPLSPMQPESAEEKTELNQIMSNSLYVPNKMIKLVKDGSEFFWVLQTQKISARFKNDTHMLKVLKIASESGEYVVLPHEYATYQGEYLLPKKIEIKSEFVLSELEIQNYYLLNSKNKNFSDRIDEYKKLLEKEKKVVKPENNQEKDLVSQYFL